MLMKVQIVLLVICLNGLVMATVMKDSTRLSVTLMVGTAVDLMSILNTVQIVLVSLKVE